MVHWQSPPVGTHNGQITGYKIRYRKLTRKSDVTETIVGTQLSQLIEGKYMILTFQKRKKTVCRFKVLTIGKPV